MQRKCNTVETLTTLGNFVKHGKSAKEVKSFHCLKARHFAKVSCSCHSPVKNTSAILMSINETQKNEEANKRGNIPVTINGRTANALIETGSTLTHISKHLSKFLKLNLMESSQKITLTMSNSRIKKFRNVSSKLRTLKSRIQKHSYYCCEKSDN